jgi:hypothetical protein
VTARVRLRAVAVEAGIVVGLGLVLTAASLGLLILEYGNRLHLRFGPADLFTAFAAGLVAAVVIRVMVRAHRRWKQAIGRFTAAAALCAVAAVAGALVVMIPPECPGGLFSTGRCDLKEAAAWGQVAGLGAVVNFGAVGFVLGVVRFVHGVARDGSAQGLTWIRAFRNRRGAGGRAAADRPRDSRESKGRPTPRRADAERARRKRLRTGA